MSEHWGDRFDRLFLMDSHTETEDQVPVKVANSETPDEEDHNEVGYSEASDDESSQISESGQISESSQVSETSHILESTTTTTTTSDQGEELSSEEETPVPYSIQKIVDLGLGRNKRVRLTQSFASSSDSENEENPRHKKRRVSDGIANSQITADRRIRREINRFLYSLRAYYQIPKDLYPSVVERAKSNLRVLRTECLNRLSSQRLSNQNLAKHIIESLLSLGTEGETQISKLQPLHAQAFVDPNVLDFVTKNFEPSSVVNTILTYSGDIIHTPESEEIQDVIIKKIEERRGKAFIKIAINLWTLSQLTFTFNFPDEIVEDFRIKIQNLLLVGTENPLVTEVDTFMGTALTGYYKAKYPKTWVKAIALAERSACVIDSTDERDTWVASNRNEYESESDTDLVDRDEGVEQHSSTIGNIVQE